MIVTTKVDGHAEAVPHNANRTLGRHPLWRSVHMNIPFHTRTQAPRQDDRWVKRTGIRGNQAVGHQPPSCPPRLPPGLLNAQVMVWVGCDTLRAIAQARVMTLEGAGDQTVGCHARNSTKARGLTSNIGGGGVVPIQCPETMLNPDSH